MFVFENVRGLVQGKHRPYFDSLLWQFRDMGYIVDWRLLNAADFGVPQTRERVFIIGRRDGRNNVTWPEFTHQKDGPSLFWRKWISWSEALKEWMQRQTPKAEPLPNWLIRHYQGICMDIPEVAFFDGARKGGTQIKQHRLLNEPAFTICSTIERHVTRLKFGELIYRLDLEAYAILQTLPLAPSLKCGQIGNSVPPMLGRAVFKAVIA